MSEAVLISIHPEYAEAILRGEKQVEFRRTRFSRPVSLLLIYATAPTSALVAYAHVQDVEEGPTDEIWRDWGPSGFVSETRFYEYFAENERAIAIVLGQVRAFSTAVALADLLPGSRPPQSFRYVAVELVEKASGLGCAIGEA
ncbi:MAG: ASCH domain-containing protein [Armatimonadetes bacterium]|nr:ASCH domain-containing protein [Armatimonadota bacterium]